MTDTNRRRAGLPLRVSIMIPAYNQPQYIEQAVASALNQTYQHIEVIVSDDSTNQDTESLLQPYLADTRFIYYKNASRLGRVANYRKLLFEYATGEWVVMLDGDDFYIDRNYIAGVVDIILQHPAVVLVGAGIQVFDEAGGNHTSSPLVETARVFDGKEVLRKKMPLPAHQTDVYLRRLACDLDFYRDPSMASDSESLFRLCLRGNVAYLPAIAAVWRVHNQNTTFNRDINKQIKEIVFIENVYKDALEKIDKTAATDWRNNMYKMIVTHLLGISFKSNNYLKSLEILLRFGKYLGFKVSVSYLITLSKQFFELQLSKYKNKSFL